MRRRWVCTLFVVLAVVQSRAQTRSANDVLYLQDGRERAGELVSMSDQEVVFWVDGAAEPTTFSKDEVQRVDLSRKRQGDDVRNVADLNDPLLERILPLQPMAFAYPDSGYVVLYSLLDYTLEKDGSYTLREREVEKVFLERGKDRANVTRYFKKGEETLDVDFARTINPDGSITPISDAAVDITSVYSGTPEYEKLYQVKFAMKQVKEGSILDYQFSKHYEKVDPLNPFYAGQFFRDEEPLIETELRINVPRDVDLAYRADRLDYYIDFSREESPDYVTCRWVGERCPRVVPESMMPAAADCYPRVAAAVKTTWESIGKAYRDAMRRSETPSDAITAKVKELTAGVNDPEEQARRIYHYFIQAMHQQWVPPYRYDYAPRPAPDIFAKRAGNSIDKAFLLYVMLRQAGLDAGVALACPQGDGKLLEDVPCIKQFSDALVAVDLPSGRQFLPITDESVRFGQMPSEYQGTKALLVTADRSELVEIPLNQPDDELDAVTYHMRVAPDGDLTVVKTEKLTGNNEINRRDSWKDQKDEELRRGFEVALTAMHPKARLDDYTIENLHDVTKPLEFTQTYTLVDYAMRAGNELLVFQIPEIEYGASSVGKPTREFPLRWWLRSKSTDDVTIEIPPGFRVYYAGKDFDADCGVAAFTARFSSSGDRVEYHDEFVQRELEAPVDAYGKYKDCIETMARVSKEWIVLERVSEE